MTIRPQASRSCGRQDAHDACETCGRYLYWQEPPDARAPREPVPDGSAARHVYTDGACRAIPGPAAGPRSSSRAARSASVSGAEPAHDQSAHGAPRRARGPRAPSPAAAACTSTPTARTSINCFRDRWYERWQRNGWLGAGRSRWEPRPLGALIAETRRHEVTWHKVAGHSGDA